MKNIDQQVQEWIDQKGESLWRGGCIAVLSDGSEVCFDVRVHPNLAINCYIHMEGLVVFKEGGSHFYEEVELCPKIEAKARRIMSKRYNVYKDISEQVFWLCMYIAFFCLGLVINLFFSSPPTH